ncbi:class II aaRS and biotin synthetase [Colletotrichum zoysiae]|uniref:Class II aaRS and biotin synthetase n=1 Tax=Colletotrichum zoysiae TaxID=1216348 RepID=A0AAD9HHM0_9PEZI|nr:class II aaRS and biotin synthetase [Colletotrichum zoysiae]
MLHPDIRHAGPRILASQNTDVVLSHRHLYLRNPLIMALSLYRSQCLSAVHEWFKEHRFVEISAPLITPSILYEPSSAIHISNLKTTKPLFLSQCAGFYLEAAAHAHERVYNLGPSFRNESRTNRHLMEYWHIKAELCSGEIRDIMDLVEIFLRGIFKAMLEHTKKVTAMLGTEPADIPVPFARITYREALKLLRGKGHEISFGQNISKQAEDALTNHFGGPVWLMCKSRCLEPFPYRVYPDDEELTMTADLIASRGFGEICGVAEKSFTREEMLLRLKEKGKAEMHDVYGWVLQSRDFGMVPHTAFGMGFEMVLPCGSRQGHDSFSPNIRS